MTQIQIRIVTFERVKMGQDTNPGDVPFKKYYYQQQYDQLHMRWRESSRWTFAAYRCTECKALFICSDSLGLQHGCTEGK